MKVRSGISLVTLASLSFAANTTFALTPFKKAFDEKYVQSSGNEAFQAAFRAQGCNICHVKDKKKEIVNAYGWLLAEALQGNAKDRLDAAAKVSDAAKKAEDDKLLTEFRAALEKVESQASPGGETYGAMFKAHRLPSAEGEKSLR